MRWLLNLLGFKGSIERKKLKLTILQQKAFEAQRSGDLRAAGKYLIEAESLETEIFEEESDKKL